MTKRQDLCLQRCSRPEQSDQRQANQADSTSLASRIEFPTMTAGLLQRQCHVPVAVSRRRGVGKDVLVDPFDGVADFCRSFRRRDHQIFHRDLNGSRHAPRQTLLTSALRQPGVSISASWEAPYFRAGGDAFGMLLVALENLETSLQHD